MGIVSVSVPSHIVGGTGSSIEGAGGFAMGGSPPRHSGRPLNFVLASFEGIGKEEKGSHVLTAAFFLH